MPARPRDAASLVIVRGKGAKTEVLLGRREPKGRFMPDVYVFPGGRVDPADARAPACSEPRAEVLERLRRACPEGRARALAVAAVRETFEETGLQFGELCDGTLRPALSGLDYIARAITPSRLPVRYHARFFVARGEHATGDLGGSGELLDLRYVPIQQATTLRIVDVTAFVLRHLQDLLAGEAPSGVPLYHYRQGKGRVRWG
ncbi:MAG: NUDIX hydrolase [Myxococcales bacterium]|nr:NUDIX hydrolase [Myxococcales bacterium]